MIHFGEVLGDQVISYSYAVSLHFHFEPTFEGEEVSQFSDIRWRELVEEALPLEIGDVGDILTLYVLSFISFQAHTKRFQSLRRGDHAFLCQPALTLPMGRCSGFAQLLPLSYGACRWLIIQCTISVACCGNQTIEMVIKNYWSFPSFVFDTAN